MTVGIINYNDLFNVNNANLVGNNPFKRGMLSWE